MPKGMFLRSSWDACPIADPHRTSTLDNYSALQTVPVRPPVPLDRFIDYGRWFQKRAVSDMDRRRVIGIEITGQGFRLDLNDGDSGGSLSLPALAYLRVAGCSLVDCLPRLSPTLQSTAI
jgi:hypothetical protein